MKQFYQKHIKIIFIIFVIVQSFVWYHILYRKRDFHNQEICETKALAINGVITGNGGHGIYTWVEINNLDKSVSLNISKTVYRKGFSNNYIYSNGDSLIKKAGEEEFTVKRGEKIIVHLLDCNE